MGEKHSGCGAFTDVLHRHRTKSASSEIDWSCIYTFLHICVAMTIDCSYGGIQACQDESIYLHIHRFLVFFPLDLKNGRKGVIYMWLISRTQNFKLTSGYVCLASCWRTARGSALLEVCTMSESISCEFSLSVWITSVPFSRCVPQNVKTQLVEESLKLQYALFTPEHGWNHLYCFFFSLWVWHGVTLSDLSSLFIHWSWGKYYNFLHIT